MLLELTVKWNLTTQINAYDMEGNQISKQNRYPCHNTKMVFGTNNFNSIEVKFTVWKVAQNRRKMGKYATRGIIC